MVEVNNHNFEEILSQFEHDINKCLFYAVDCEFTALPSDFVKENSFFEDGSDRYRKIIKNIHGALVIQVGITPFRHYRDLNHFKAHPYNFYVFPKPFGSFDASAFFKASSIKFLSSHHFNFNKVFYDGISYMNLAQKKTIIEHVKNGTLSDFVASKLSYEQIDEILLNCETVKKWAASCDIGQQFDIPCKPCDAGFNFVLKEEICKLTRDVRAIFENNKIIVTKVTSEERSIWEKEEDESNAKRLFLESLDGFSKIYNILAASKKPLVGHNLFNDLLTTYNQFYDELPGCYSQFKKSLNTLFPVIYDTKFIAFELKRLKDEDDWSTSLSDIFDRYQDTKNVFHFPYVILDPPGIYSNVEEQKVHNAGWDSYMTGFIFLKMADEVVRIERTQKYMMNVTSMEMLSAVERWKNLICIARSRVSHLNLQGDDPPSKRPPLLHVCRVGEKALGTVELDAAFKQYEPLHKRPLNQNSALIAVPNFKCFKRILLDFSNSNEFIVEKYSLFHHHRGVRACLIAGVLLPVAVTVWFGLKPH